MHVILGNKNLQNRRENVKRNFSKKSRQLAKKVSVEVTRVGCETGQFMYRMSTCKDRDAEMVGMAFATTTIMTKKISLFFVIETEVKQFVGHFCSFLCCCYAETSDKIERLTQTNKSIYFGKATATLRIGCFEKRTKHVQNVSAKHKREEEKTESERTIKTD